MMDDDRLTFAPEVTAKLRTYVYRLIDPRNGETFYVGKGQGNRVFDHIREQIDETGDPGNKLRRIRDIRLSGFEVAHVIHRHGMALAVEAALMDAYPGLTNEASGQGSGGFDAMHAKEIIRFFKHKAILINVNRSSVDRSLYEATHYAWKVSLPKARQAELVLATRQGLIIGAFTPTQWLEATTENFAGREPMPERFGFIGVEAPDSVARLYLQKRVPDELRRPGSANPVRYTWR